MNRLAKFRSWVVGPLVAFSGFCHADTIQFVADEWCPYTCESHSDHPGFLVEIVQAALGAYGHKVVYEVVPWARAVQLVERGARTGVLGTDQGVTPGLVFPKKEQGYGVWKLYAKAGDPWRYTDLESLNGRSIGLIEGYNYNEFSAYFAANPGACQLDYSFGETPLAKSVTKLLNNRFNTIIENEPVMMQHLNKTKHVGQIVSAGQGSQFVTYAAFSPKNPKASLYAEQLSNGMDMIRKSGQLAKIMARYGLSDWVHKP